MPASLGPDALLMLAGLHSAPLTGNLSARHAFVRVMVIVRLARPDAQGRSVFVSAGAFRARALRGLGYVTGTLLLLWLAALIAGAVGAGRLPAVPFPAVGALRETPATHASPQSGPRPALQVTPSGALAPRKAVPVPAGSPVHSGQPGSARRGDGVPGTVPRHTSGRDVGQQQPAAGNAPPAPAGQAQPSTPPSGGTAPGQAVPAPAPQPAPGRGAGPPADRPPTANGGSATPPPNRPVDPPAGGTSATPPATRPVDPPAAPPGTADGSSTG
jgi:hypothetical protein